jgi:amidase
MGDLLVRPALELAGLLRSGRVHGRELVEAALVRLEEQEGRINAFSFIDAERALAAAEKISPRDPRPFAGVPIAIKDGTPELGKPCVSARPSTETTSPTTKALRSGG